MQYRTIYESFIKRPHDFLVAFVAINLLSPVLIIAAIVIRFKLGSPVIFKQARPGLNEKIFTMYKFRTMTDEKDDYGNLLSDEVRLTKFGKFVRSTSIDELPGLFNVLKGDMALVGPRPLLVQYLEKYSDFQKQRHQVRPGLTGLAQVNGRNELNWSERFNLDVEYVKNVSFYNDYKIIILTILKVLKRDGINTKDGKTMGYFEGEQK